MWCGCGTGAEEEKEQEQDLKKPCPTRSFMVARTLLRRVHMFFVFFRVRLSVLRGHSFFSSPPQRPMTSDFEGFSIPDFIHYTYFPILIFEKEPVFSLLNVQC